VAGQAATSEADITEGPASQAYGMGARWQAQCLWWWNVGGAERGAFARDVRLGSAAWSNGGLFPNLTWHHCPTARFERPSCIAYCARPARRL